MHGTEPTHWRILRLLKAHAGEYVSGTALAAELRLSRTGIWKQIHNLHSLGYEIERHPRRGYRLAGIPDLLITEEVLPQLRTAWLARSYHHFQTVGSTNDQALSLAMEGAPHGTVVVAEEQTQGRGRLRRPWVSAQGKGIYLSIILRKPAPVREAPQTTLVAALALARMLREEYTLPAVIKWPNDVLAGGAKLSGILTEMQSDQDLVRFIVLGVGINVNHTTEELSGPFRYPATSIAAEIGHSVPRREVLLAFFESFEAHFDRFLESGFGAMIPDFEATSAILGRSITVQCGDRDFSGKAVGFTKEGALKLLIDDGREEIIWAGDITQLGAPFHVHRT